MGLACVLATLVATTLAAQEPQEWMRPTPIDGERIRPVLAAGAGADPASARFSAVDVQLGPDPDTDVERLPFSNPVRDIEIGRLPDGTVIVLAGGVREGLDVLRFDPTMGVLERYPTEGGRRLPTAFGGGRGSWPLADDAGLLLFAFERDDAVQFFAAVARRILASRTLPLECEDFRAHLDAASRRVEVEFLDGAGESIDELDFPHPIAPRLVLEGAEGGRVDFGEVTVGEGPVTRRILFRNEGLYRLDGRIVVDEAGFAVDGDPALELAPGEEVGREVRFEPQAPGEIVARLRVESEAPSARGVVELRGRAREGPAAEPAGGAGADPITGGAPPGAGIEAAPTGAADAPRFERPDAVDLRALWVDVGRLSVAVRLAPEDAHAPRLAVRLDGDDDRISTWPVYRPGQIEAVVAAQALELIEVAVVGPGGRGDWLAVGLVPAALRLEGRWVAVHAPAFSDFLLLEVVASDDPESTRRVLRAWRGRADGRGLARFDLADFVGDGVEPVRLQLMIRSFRAGTWPSSVLEL